MSENLSFVIIKTVLMFIGLMAFLYFIPGEW